jgi:mono/diheme cytochrome c family protein
VIRPSLAAAALAALTLAAAPLSLRDASAQAQGAAPQQGQTINPQQPGAQGGVPYQGWKMFHVYCYRCHGTDAIHNEAMPGPDLRDSIKSITWEQYEQTVKEGRLPKGMPAWGELLTEQQVKDIYAYLVARSNGSLKPGRPDEQ